MTDRGHATGNELTASPDTPRSLPAKAAEFFVVTICTLAFVLTASGIVHALIQKNAAGQRDFVEYWASGQLLANHANPYDAAPLLATERSAGLPTDVSVMVLPNPPIALPLVAPLGYLPALPAEWLWCSALLLCFVISIWAVRRSHARPSSPLDLLAYSFAPAMCCLLLGQMSMLVLLGLALFLYWNGARPLAAGAALCLCALKPHLLLPFAAVLLVWILQTRRYRLLAGAVIGLSVAIAATLALDHHAFADYSAMMHGARVDKVPIPCLSNAFRRAIAPNAMWLQYLPGVLGCVWALEYYSRHRDAWDWITHGSLLTLVSFAVAPYSWLPDQCVLVPALLHGLYVTRSRSLVAILALASAAMQLAIFGGGTRLLHSPWLLWTVPLWLAWYLLAIRISRHTAKVATPSAQSALATH